IGGGQISPVTTVANVVSESRTRMTLLRLLMCCVRMSSSLFAFEPYAINSAQESQARIDRLQPGASRHSHGSRHGDHGARGDGPIPRGTGAMFAALVHRNCRKRSIDPRGLPYRLAPTEPGPAARTV